jgi:hypothetical protein
MVGLEIPRATALLIRSLTSSRGKGARLSTTSESIAINVAGAGLAVDGPPGLSSELLRLAARQAHVHLFTDTECNVWANGPFVLLHAAYDGPITLNTARTAPIHDLLTGAVLGRGPKITLTLQKGETRIVRSRGDLRRARHVAVRSANERLCAQRSPQRTTARPLA